MINRKLLEVLQKFSPAERSKLRLFLLSPYFSRSHAAELVQLYDLILKHNADLDAPALDKAKVAARFFPDKPYQEGKKGPLDTLTSEFFNLVKKFMALQTFESGDMEFEEGLSLARFYRQHGMEERYAPLLQSVRKAQSDWPYRDATYYQRQFMLEEEAATYASLNNSFEDDANLLRVTENLDISYLLHKMEILCLLRYQQQLTQNLNFRVSDLLTQAALSYPEHLPKTPLYELNRLVFHLIEHPDDYDKLDAFDELVQGAKTSIPFDKLRNLQAFFRIFWMRRYLKSSDALTRQRYFQICKEHFEAGYYFEGENILVHAFRNLVQIGLRVKEYNWVLRILEEHPPERIRGTNYPQEIHNLCMAEYLFYTKKYDKATDTLTYKLFNNPTFSIFADLLLIKILFDTGNDLVDYRLKALEQKVRRTQLSPVLKERYLKFLQHLDKIMRYGLDKRSSKHQSLIESINTGEGIIEREWLLEKLGVSVPEG